MKALTLQAPWAWAIIYGGKDIENRTWPPPANAIGSVIAIHAGLKSDRSARTELQGRGLDVPKDFTKGAILGTVQLVGFIERVHGGWSGGGISPTEVARYARSGWLRGPIGWILGKPKPLHISVKARGAQGLWTIREPVLSAIVGASPLNSRIDERSPYIANDQLVRSLIPRTGAPWREVAAFASTFNWYAAYGSFELCAEVANRRDPQTLTELRGCLLFERRRWRHFGEDPDDEAMSYLYTLLERIREDVDAG